MSDKTDHDGMALVSWLIGSIAVGSIGNSVAAGVACFFLGLVIFDAISKFEPK